MRESYVIPVPLLLVLAAVNALSESPLPPIPSVAFTITYSSNASHFTATVLDAQVKARKADGSSAQIARSPDGARQDYHIYDVRTEEARLIAPDAKLKTRIRRSRQQELGAELDPATSCTERYDRVKNLVTEVLDGEDTILGYKTYRLILSTRDDKTTVWRAPELACYPLKTYTEFKGKGPSNSTVMALKVVFGAPDEALFTGPEGLRDVDPKDFLKSLRAARSLAR